MLLLLIGILGYGYYAPRQAKQSLAECSKSATGSVVSIRKRVGKIPVIEYEFEIDGEMYNGVESFTSSEAQSDLKAGSEVIVDYECDNPENNKVR